MNRQTVVQPQTKSVPSPPGKLLQRTCACGQHSEEGECEECRKKGRILQRQKENGSEPTELPAIVHEVLRSPGQPLDPSTLAFFKTRFAHDFTRVRSSVHGVAQTGKPTIGPPRDSYEQEAERVADAVMHSRPSLEAGISEPGSMHDHFTRVRVHTGAKAAESARAVNALAYTVGRDIVFATGRYAPATTDGRRLLAHELTHVVQQAGGHERSTPMDSGLHDDQSPTAALTRRPSTVRAGTQALGARRLQRAASDFEIRGKEPRAASEPMTIFFRERSSTLDAAERAKIAPIATPPGRALTLNGFASEEGPAAGNVALTNARLAAVEAALVAAGHTGPRTLVPQPTAGSGRIDYRQLRSVEIVPAGAVSAVPNCAAGAVIPCGPAPNRFTTAQAEAGRILGKASLALGAVPLAPATAAVLTRFFGGVASASTVKGNLDRLRTHVTTEMTPENAAGPGHRCGNLCDSSCTGADAYNVGAGASALMTLCPSFLSTPSLAERAGVLIHEGAHGTTGLATDDLAYSHERLITFLSPADALRNTDSYVLFVRLLDSPGSVAVGPASPDPLTGGMTDPEKVAARRTVAWLEKWLIWSYQEVGSLYSTIHGSMAAGSWTSPYYRATMSLLAPRFALTAPPAVPTMRDKISVAAIHDRYLQMRTALRSPVTINKVAAGTPSWAAGPGSTVTVTPTFFGLTPRAQLDLLLAKIVNATPDISSALEPQYVQLVNQIRIHQGGGSP